MARSFLSKIKETLILLWINLKVKAINLVEYGRVVIHYYPHAHFAKIDTALLLSYLFSNPFHISKRFLIEKGEREVYTYGETPLTTMDLIARQCDITSQDVVFELGCGRGRTCFWLNQILGCSAVGIDYVPAFIEKAQKIKDRFQVQRVSFRLEDLFQANLKGATVIYLYGTCFSAAYIDLLIERLSKLPEGTKIITASYALTEFQPGAPFRIIKQFSVPFTWGETDVYLQEKA
jgi:hypothetical protein